MLGSTPPKLSPLNPPSASLPLLHALDGQPITPPPAPPCLPKLPLRLHFSLLDCTGTGNSERDIPPFLNLLSSQHQPMALTLPSPWLLAEDSASNNLTMASESYLFRGSLWVPLMLFLNHRKMCFLRLPFCLRTGPAFPLRMTHSWEACSFRHYPP